MAAPTLVRREGALPARVLTLVQAGDAVACAIPLPILKEALDNVGCPPALQRAIPLVKAASVVGLVAGHRQRALGRLTTTALVGYFLCAIGAHARVKDSPDRYVAAVGMLGLTLAARRSYR